MPRRYALLMLISVFVVVCVAANCWFTFNEHGLPFTVAVVSARTAVISPTSGQEFRGGAQGVAVYEDNDKGYARSRHKGKQEFREQVATDDLAFVRLRVGKREVDLHDLGSALGQEGYVFPMSVRGSVIGALVCGPRPGEAYTADERKLLAHVAHQVGTALHALRVQETMKQMESKAKLVDALASGALPAPSNIQTMACELVNAATPSWCNEINKDYSVSMPMNQV